MKGRYLKNPKTNVEFLWTEALEARGDLVPVHRDEPVEEGEFKCPVPECGKAFKSQKALNMHMQMIHKEDK